MTALRKRSLHELTDDEQAAYDQMVEIVERVASLEDDVIDLRSSGDEDQLALAKQDLEEARERFSTAASGLVSKVDNVADFIMDMEASGEACDREIDRLRAKRDRFQHAEQRLREYVLRIMEMQGRDELCGTLVTLKRRLNPEAVEITNPAMIPDTLKRVPPPAAAVPDRTLIKEAIKRGEAVTGARIVRRAKLVIQ